MEVEREQLRSELEELQSNMSTLMDERKDALAEVSKLTIELQLARYSEASLSSTVQEHEANLDRLTKDLDRECTAHKETQKAKKNVDHKCSQLSNELKDLKDILHKVGRW